MSDRVLEQVPANGGCAFLFFSLINEKKRVTISPFTQTTVFIANYGIPSKLLFKCKYLFVIIIWLLLLAWVKCINTARHTEMLCFWAEYNYVGYINVAIMCNYVCTLDFLRCSTFLLLSHIFSFSPFFFFLLLPSVLLVLTSSKLERWVATALCSPFPSEEALECSPSHSLPAQCCIHINSYQSSSCIQMLRAAQYRLHWKEKMKKTKQAAENEREGDSSVIKDREIIV